jgi:hypothetical protein
VPSSGSLLVVLVEVVGKGVHLIFGGKDGIEVHEDVVGGEGDELASAPKYLAEERVGLDGLVK